LLLEDEILCDYRSDATGATELRGQDGEVQQGEQKVLHARVSVGQAPGATQRCPIRDSARELAIRDAQALPRCGQPASPVRTLAACGDPRILRRDRLGGLLHEYELAA
jgi:hypothetical protein